MFTMCLRLQTRLADKAPTQQDMQNGVALNFPTPRATSEDTLGQCPFLPSSPSPETLTCSPPREQPWQSPCTEQVFSPFPAKLISNPGRGI